MDKEEAIKILKDFHDKSALFSVRTALETLHPELAESEDEKTRKRIIALVNAHGQGMYKDDMLTWLEKQSEQKQQRMVSAEAKEALYDKPDWGKEDESYLNTTIAYLKDAQEFKKTAENCIDWLKKLKQRIGDKL